MFENRRMPNGTSEPSLGLCGVGGRACEGSLYPIVQEPLEGASQPSEVDTTLAALSR